MDQKVSSFQGFLQKTEEGKWILCDAPNLKSCCLKKHVLVTLEGDFSRYSTKTAVIAQGIYNEGHLSAISIQEKNNPFPYWSIGAAVLLFCLWRLIKSSTKSRKERPLPL